MNFTYFKFLFITTIKKRPIWITWALYLFTCIAFLIILPAVARMNTLQVWANTTMAVCQTFLGMTVALFTSVLAIHIFKDGLEEGTELIIISKPISRFKIVLTKFIIFATFCLMVNLTSLIITLFTAFLPTTEWKFYWALIVSMFIGNLVCFGVWGSISVLSSINFAKVGVIILNIMLAIIFLVYQCLTLFVFEVPIKSLSNHNVTAPSYILSNRDMKTGEYKEEEVVCFKTDYEKQWVLMDESQWNKSTNWKEAKEYWTGEICKNDPTLILNCTDFAGQISLTYLSVGLDQYAYRQGRRFFAISRFYTYDLNSPASPEIISGVENKKTLPWVYSKTKLIDIDFEGLGKYQIRLPNEFTFAGIAPLGTTRLRGYEDRIPIGFYVKSGEALSTKDVYFEPDEWQKYVPAFNLICDYLFNYEYYWDTFTEQMKKEPWNWPNYWDANNASLNRYYNLLWSCFTGHSAEPQYFNNDFLKNYDRAFFNINSVNDLNERFLQFKYFTYYRALQEQQALLNSLPSDPDELKARQEVLDENLLYQMYSTLFGIKQVDTNWFMQSDEEATVPYIEPGTQAPNLELIDLTNTRLREDLIDQGEEGSEKYYQKLTNTTFAKYKRTQSIIISCTKPHEEFLFSSLEKPERSAEYHGKAYVVSDDWHSYWESLIAPVGQNMNYFYYTSRETVNYWVYTVIWGIISLSLFAAGAVLYNKYDVK